MPSMARQHFPIESRPGRPWPGTRKNGLPFKAIHSCSPLAFHRIARRIALEHPAHLLRRQAVLRELVFVTADFVLRVVVYPACHSPFGRSEARRVGKGGLRTCRSRV